LIASFFARIARLPREERPFAALMSAIFFLLISAFWIVKPLKKAAFNAYYADHREGLELFGVELDAARIELLAKLLTVVLAGGAAVAFSTLSRRLTRHRLFSLLGAGFIAMFAVFAMLLETKSDAAVWAFYVTGDLYVIVMVPAFFAFLNDSLDPAAAQRLHGWVVLGGVAGGAFGATFLSLWAKGGESAWLFACAALCLAAVVLANFAGRSSRSEPEPTSLRGAAFEGAALVAGSRYLMAIVALVGIYEIVSTMLDFQFTATINYYLEGEARRSQMFSVYALTNVASLVIQILVATLVLRRFRLTLGLTLMPIVVMLGAGAFYALPLLWFGSLLNTYDNALHYSVNQSSREVLYTPESRAAKYKAKAFIDMFVQRFAKAAGVLLVFAITALLGGESATEQSFLGARWLALATMLLCAVWIAIARFAGSRFEVSAQAPATAFAPRLALAARQESSPPRG
jgi:ATP:ADP antiporter, AAA family